MRKRQASRAELLQRVADVSAKGLMSLLAKRIRHHLRR